jgi:two-component system response regulator AgrA
MVHIFICEDDPIQRARIQGIVNAYLLKHESDMDLALAADNPAAILDYVTKHQIKGGLYFFDVDLQSDIHGIELGAKIRAMDVSASLVFITTHADRAYMVFRYKLEAMEYITKDSPPAELERRIVECIQVAYQRYLDGKHAKTKIFTVKTGDQIQNIPYDNILFFESMVDASNKISLYKKTGGKIDFYESLGNVAKQGLPFFRCHRAFVVNIDNVVRLDKVARELKMEGDELVPVSKRSITELVKLIKQ